MNNEVVVNVTQVIGCITNSFCSGIALKAADMRNLKSGSGVTPRLLTKTLKHTRTDYPIISSSAGMRHFKKTLCGYFIRKVWYNGNVKWVDYALSREITVVKQKGGKSLKLKVECYA